MALFPRHPQEVQRVPCRDSRAVHRVCAGPAQPLVDDGDCVPCTTAPALRAIWTKVSCVAGTVKGAITSVVLIPPLEFAGTAEPRRRRRIVRWQGAIPRVPARSLCRGARWSARWHTSDRNFGRCGRSRRGDQHRHPRSGGGARGRSGWPRAAPGAIVSTPAMSGCRARKLKVATQIGVYRASAMYII